MAPRRRTGEVWVGVSSSLAKMAVSRNPDIELVFRSISSSLFFLLLLLASFPRLSESSCRRGCDLAIGSYYIPLGSKTNLTYISSLFDKSISDVLAYNPRIVSEDSIDDDSRINVSFTCDCLADGAILGHVFSYQTVFGDTYTTIASTVYSNLTTEATLMAFNSYSPNRIPDGENINVTVNCSCGDADVSRAYGLFVTYPLRPGENLSSVAAEWGFSGQQDLLKRYNQGANFSAGEGIVFIPTKGQVFIEFCCFLTRKDRIFGFWNYFCVQNPCILCFVLLVLDDSWSNWVPGC